VVAACGGNDHGAADRTARRPATTTTTSTSTTTTTTTASAAAGIGAADVGDPLSPGSGNGGFDVQHYEVSIDATDPTGSITVRNEVTAVATQALRRFDLDLAGMEVTSVTVDGRPAQHSRVDAELQITPEAPLAEGATFTVVVDYHGVPDPVLDGSLGEEIGWLRSAAGDTYVVSEPDGAKSFLASSDHPSDKATFTFHLRVRTGTTAVANGELKEQRPDGDATMWTWAAAEPMATYLVQVAIGAYEVVDAGVHDGVDVRHVVLKSLPGTDRRPLDATAEILSTLSSRFGRYPFPNAGVLVADSPDTFALETQGLVILPSSWFRGRMPDDETVTVIAHELAHQWFGDWVTPARWSDIWLNEGFATWAEWLWSEHLGQGTIVERADATHPSAVRWRRQFGPVTSPNALSLFSPNQYGGAGVVVEALRRTLGDQRFDRLLHEWLTRFGGKSATTADFEALASEVAGKDLTTFFDAWLRSTDLPPMPPAR